MAFTDYIADLTATKVRSLVDAATDVRAAREANQKFYDGDHFQAGAGWIGPGFDRGHSQYSQFMELLESAFISENAIKAAVDADWQAAIGKEPKWGSVPVESAPDDEEQAKLYTEKYSPLQSAADADLTDWWDKNGIHAELQKFARIYRTQGAAGLRIFLPPDEYEDGQVSQKPFKDSLLRLYVEAVEPAAIKVHRHSGSMREIGLYLFSEQINDDGSVRTEQRAELTYVDPTSGKTILAVAGGDKEQTAAGTPLDLAGQLWHFFAEDGGIISPQVRSQQKKLNLAHTVERRNLADNGWLEQFLINCRLPGSFETETVNGITTTRYVPDDRPRGPSYVQNLVSETITSTDEAGAETHTVLPASVQFRDPIDPEHSIKSQNAARSAILRECHQEVFDESGADAASSGESQKQRRWRFLVNLAQAVAVYNAAGRWLLDTVTRIAAAHSRTANPYALLRWEFECRIDSGPLSADEKRELKELVQAELLSRETAMARMGVDDVDAEWQRIESENKTNAAAQKAQSEADEMKWKAASAAQMAGIGRDTSLMGAGMTEEEISAMDEMEMQRMMSDTSSGATGAQLVGAANNGGVSSGA